MGRRTFSVFGAAGVAIYMGHLASKFFADIVMFPIACVVIGFLIIGLGYLWHKHEPRISAGLRRMVGVNEERGVAA